MSNHPLPVEIPENHVNSVRALLRILDSDGWVADLVTDIVGHCEIYGLGECTPEWLDERLTGTVLFLGASGSPRLGFRSLPGVLLSPCDSDGAAAGDGAW